MTDVAPEATASTTDSTAQPAVSDTTVATLADAITNTDVSTGPDNRPTDGAVLRYGSVTAVGTGVNLGKAQTDTTGVYWNPCDNSYLPTLGDLVYLFQQGPVSHIGGRLGGSPSGPPVGVIHSFAGATAPVGWLLCDGSAVSRTDYAELFAVCGTTYGTGNGSTTFNLPNLIDRVPTGSGSKFARGETGGSETFTMTSSQMPAHTHGSGGSHSHGSGGSHSHSGSTHTHGSGGAHTHGSGGPHSHTVAVGDSGSVKGVTGGTGNFNYGGASHTTSSTDPGSTASTDPGPTASGGGGATGSTDPGATASTDPGATASTGSGSAVNNMPPYLAVAWIVRATR